jgi:hypothetical protein
MLVSRRFSEVQVACRGVEVHQGHHGYADSPDVGFGIQIGPILPSIPIGPVLGSEEFLSASTEELLARAGARAYEVTECRFNKVTQLESWVHGGILRWVVRIDLRIVGNEDVFGLDV